MALLLYTLLIIALLPWAVLHLLWRARRQPEYLQHWSERFGLFAPSPRAHQDGSRCIWIHAVSVGETRAAQPLVTALRAKYPQHRILFTHMTPTGRATSVDLYGDSVQRIYLPYDTPWAMRSFLHHVRPQVGIIMETELWPNLVAQCKIANIPLWLVNARLSDRSAARYTRFAALTRNTLGALTGIGAQSNPDAERLRQLGATHVTVTGNLKFDIEAPAAQLMLAQTLRERIGHRPVWLAASTRAGEEALILDAWRSARQKVGPPGALPSGRNGEVKCPPWDTAVAATTAILVIVPRHPQRFDEVCQLAKDRGFTVQRRTEDTPVAPATEILIGDSMGEMFAWYAAVDVAFIGGSLLDFGSQNLIEACAVGCPVLIGPSTYNFAGAAKDATLAGAAVEIRDADDLARQVHDLLSNDERRQRMAAAGRAFAQQHRGATQRTLALVDAAMRATQSPLPS